MTTLAVERVSREGLHWHEESSTRELAVSLGRAVAERLDAALAAGGEASLVVSGGSTPAPVFSYLASADIDWSRVGVTLADERWVPPSHPDSNEALIRDTLLRDKAAAARFVPLYRDGMSDAQAQARVAAELGVLRRPFTAVLLGMGGDGHTASLFPDAAPGELSAAMDLASTELVAFLHPVSVPQVRISLTRATLLDAEHRYLHITGKDKLEVLTQALEQCQGQSWQQGMPPVIGLLTEQPDRASVYWSP